MVTEAVTCPALRPHPASRASIAIDPARMISFSSKGRYCMPIRLLLQLIIGSVCAHLETGQLQIGLAQFPDPPADIEMSRLIPGIAPNAGTGVNSL